MFENPPKNQNSNPGAPMRPSSGEPEDILKEIDSSVSFRPQTQAKPFVKSAPPPPNLPTSRPQPQAAPFGTGTLPPLPHDRDKTDDIFSDVDTSRPKIAVPLGPKTPGSPSLPEGLRAIQESEKSEPFQEEAERKKPLLKSKWFLVSIFVIIGLGGVSLAGFFVYQSLIAERAVSPEEDTLSPDEFTAPSPAEVQPEITPTPQADVIDTDLDGLTDSEENALGTDISRSDSDSDGLTDRDEAKTWGTDPWNPDSDGDGYKDGEEVANRYDPKGPGKLIEGGQ